MVKMKTNKNEKSNCSCCNANWRDTPDMIDIMINKNMIFSLCHNCYEIMSQKLLKVSCMYNSRIKTKEDITRIQREKHIIEEKLGIKHMSINQAMKGMGYKDE